MKSLKKNLNIKLIKMIEECERKHKKRYYKFSLVVDDFYYLTSGETVEDVLRNEFLEISELDTVETCGNYLFTDNKYYGEVEKDIQIFEVILEIEVNSLKEIREKLLDLIPEEFI